MVSTTEQLRLQLLTVLSDRQFHSGTELGELFGISRSAISQHIQTIKEWGIDVFAVAGKGYRLAEAISLLDLEPIRQQLSTVLTTLPVLEYFPHIDSTNAYLMDRLGDGQLANGHCVLAEAQTQGRGRRGRVWQSPFASNIYLSMFWRLERGVAAAMGLSLVIGVCVVRALARFNIPTQLKWPNDVLVNGKKLAGILVELQGQNGGECDVVIGVGLNVAMPGNSAAQIDQPWIDIKTLIGQLPDRSILAAELIAQLVEALPLYDAEGFTPFMDAWRQHDAFMGKTVKVISGTHQTLGTVRGVTSQGALLLSCAESGELKTFFGGEVSLRGAE